MEQKNYDSNYVSDEEVAAIIEQYQKQQLTENLMGPGVSLVAHIVMLSLCFLLIVTSTRNVQPPVEVTVVELEKVELEPEVEQEIEEIEEDLTCEDVVEDPVMAPEDIVGEQTSPNDVSDEAPQTNDNMDQEMVLDVKMTNSPLTYFDGGGRSDQGRKKGIERTGGDGTRRGQIKLNKALRWLARVQNENGSWGEGNFGPESGHPAHTGLALLTFLGHGETPLSEQYGMTVQKAMRWLAEYGHQSDLASRCNKRPMGYAHGIATYAICEAYGMTKIPIMQGAMEACVEVIIDGQMSNGGFGYGYTSGPRWDMSVAGWNIQALKAARMAGCINEKLPEAIYKAVKFCKKVYVGKGGFAYAQSKPGARGANMTGVGALCMQLLGSVKDARVKQAAEYIGNSRLKDYQEVATNPAKWDSIGGKNLYGWYYETQVIFNTQKNNRARWKAWRNAFETALTKTQHPEGYWQTSGQHQIGTHNTPGRVLSTCLCALQLEVYYRYLPSFDIKKVNEFSAIDGIDLVGDLDGDGGIKIEIE
jgi:hypothetical protein